MDDGLIYYHDGLVTPDCGAKKLCHGTGAFVWERIASKGNITSKAISPGRALELSRQTGVRGNRGMCLRIRAHEGRAGPAEPLAGMF